MGVVLPYTRVRGPDGSTARKPYLWTVLRHGERFTPVVNLLVDTGSEFCIFDATLARRLLALDVESGGRAAVMSGIDGRDVRAHVHPIRIFARDLKREFEIREAYFCNLRGLAGVLGHNGFPRSLGKSFEFEDPPDPEG